jgi:general stress protein 26
MAQNDELKPLLQNLFSDQRLAVLGTQSREGPYGSLVAFYATEDLRNLLFATARSTRKYENLMEVPRVFLLIDNRSNREGDFQQAIAVTATGSVKEAVGEERKQLEGLFLAKHPSLLDFLQSDGCALLKMEVQTYFIVRQFQQTTELHMKP